MNKHVFITIAGLLYSAITSPTFGEVINCPFGDHPAKIDLKPGFENITIDGQTLPFSVGRDFWTASSLNREYSVSIRDSLKSHPTVALMISAGTNKEFESTAVCTKNGNGM